VGYTQRGEASYYGNQFHGRKTASGEKFNMNELTAAHPRIRFNTLLRVTNTLNNKSVIVRINDRGPYVGNRIIDLSKAAAAKIDMIRSGVAPVQLEVIYVETGPVTDRERKANEERIRKQEEKGIKTPSTTKDDTANSEENKRQSVLERIRRLLGKRDKAPDNQEESTPEPKQEEQKPPVQETQPEPKREQKPPVQENKPKPEPKEAPANRPVDAETFAGINTYKLDGTITYPDGHGVQVGSYNKLETAIQIGRNVEQTRLSNVYIQTGWAGSTRIFRVIAGEGTPEQARELAEKLKTKGFNGFIKQHY
jgi:rare lipoprotein A